MKVLHNVSITVFIELGEDEKLIAEHITPFLPENFVEQKITMEIEELRIDEGKNIKKLHIKLTKERHTKYFLKVFKEFIGEENCHTIASQENRVDAKGKLFIRLDKTDLMEHEKATLVDHGTCVHFSLMIAAYPKTQERARELAKEIFQK